MKTKVTERCRMTSLHAFKLMTWLSNNPETSKLAGPELAANATKELGFLVSRASVNKCRNDLGIVKEVHPKRGPYVSKSHATIKLLAQELLVVLEALNMPRNRALITLAGKEVV